MSTDEKEYATGDNPNPADQPFRIPRKDDWQGAMLARRQKATEDAAWYPRAQGAPETQVPRRFKAFEVDEGDFQANISPQRWDCTLNQIVPLNDGAHGNPIEIVPFLPGRAEVFILNTGANPLIISPSLETALNGRGITLASGGQPFSLATQGGFYAWATGGASTVQAWWTQYEAPTTHLPPKDREG